MSSRTTSYVFLTGQTVGRNISQIPANNIGASYHCCKGRVFGRSKNSRGIKLDTLLSYPSSATRSCKRLHGSTTLCKQRHQNALQKEAKGYFLDDQSEYAAGLLEDAEKKNNYSKTQCAQSVLNYILQALRQWMPSSRGHKQRC